MKLLFPIQEHWIRHLPIDLVQNLYFVAVRQVVRSARTYPNLTRSKNPTKKDYIAHIQSHNILCNNPDVVLELLKEDKFAEHDIRISDIIQSNEWEQSREQHVRKHPRSAQGIIFPPLTADISLFPYQKAFLFSPRNRFTLSLSPVYESILVAMHQPPPSPHNNDIGGQPTVVSSSNEIGNNGD